MRDQSIRGHILTPQGFVKGELAVGQEGRIRHIAGDRVDETVVRSSPLPIVLPGFIDTHVHGGGGKDVMEGGEAAEVIAALHAQHGTTSLLATTMTAPANDLTLAFNGLAPLFVPGYSAAGRTARVLGVHLEGPYINPGKLGAQPDYARDLSVAELARLNALAPIRLITLAPEMPGNLHAISQLIAGGYVVQIGHSAATYEETKAALDCGARGFTHLFNAMTGLHHRKPGVAGAALAHGEFAEIIPDLLHVHEGAMRVAMRCIPRLFCVTDSTSAAGMPDGEYRLGRQTVTKCLGGVRLADGTLAGSTLTMDQAFRNMVNALGQSLIAASARVATNAADYLKLNDRGRLLPGAVADFVVLDRDLMLKQVVTEGVAL